MFSLFDNFGEPYNAPNDWGSITEHLNDYMNRLGQGTRARLLRGETYQSQVFIHSFEEIPQDVRREAIDRYLKARGHLRDSFLKRRPN